MENHDPYRNCDRCSSRCNEEKGEIEFRPDTDGGDFEKFPGGQWLCRGCNRLHIADEAAKEAADAGNLLVASNGDVLIRLPAGIEESNSTEKFRAGLLSHAYTYVVVRMIEWLC